jgi:hypothetical protein
MSQQPLDYSSVRRLPEKSRWARAIIGAAIGVVVSIPTVFTGIASGGMGHGHYLTARALFPIPLLLARFNGGSVDGILIVAVLLQFPVYGAIIGWLRGFRRLVGSLAIVAVHFCAAAACFSGAVPSFS